MKNISILGSDCVITLIANLNNLSTSFEHWSRAPKDVFKKPGNPSDVFYYVFAVIVITVLIVMYQVWRIRMIHIVNNFTAKQMEGMDLDLIKSITNRTMLEAIADLTRDEIMEIEREQINVLEMLGEGAFGLVKKAMMVRDGKKHQVAVKMLKSKMSERIWESFEMVKVLFFFIFFLKAAATLTISSSFIKKSRSWSQLESTRTSLASSDIALRISKNLCFLPSFAMLEICWTY